MWSSICNIYSPKTEDERRNMSKKLEDMTPKEIDDNAEENAKKWVRILGRIEKASKSTGITTDKGLHFVDVFFENKEN